MLSRVVKKKNRFGSSGHHSHAESPSILHRNRRVQRVLVGIAFLVMVAAVTQFSTLRSQTEQYDIETEAVASRTVRATFAFESVDLEATREARENAAALVPITYNVDLERAKNQLLTLQQRINTIKERRPEVETAIRKALHESNSGVTREVVVKAAVSELARLWKEDPLFEGFPEASVLAVWLMPRLDTVPTREFEVAPAPDPDRDTDVVRAVQALTEAESPDLDFQNIEPITSLALQALEHVLINGVIQPGNITQGQDAPKVRILRGRVIGDLKPGEELELADIPVPNTARARLGVLIAERVKELESKDADKSLDWELVQTASFEIAKTGVTDTLFYDQVVTEGNRELARANVDPVTRHIDANQIIQEDGHHWTQQSRSDVTAYWGLVGGGQPTRSILGPIAANLILVGLLLLALMRAIPVVTSNDADGYKSLNVVLLLMCGTLILGRIIWFIEPSGFSVPLPACAILIAILTNARLAALASLLTAILLSIQYGYQWDVLMVGSAMSFGGISSLYVVRRRSDMARAAVIATVVGMFALLAVTLAADSLVGWTTFQLLAKVVLNGIICLFVVPGLLSPLERLFGITTDIQLLEYSDLNNEILSRLAIEVPATYAHSLMMGQLAEAASDAIGANGLLARVCAYYHDIGKLRRPEYFSENQTGQNIHDDLSPRLSSRAIASHVTEGIEIAREYHLPLPIIGGIQEHHGTLLISFFYQQALDQQKHGDVRERDYRYPGPRPQSRETAILMICDAVESGVRTIKNPNEERVREFVEKIIHARSADRQFDECELTLKKLDIIGEVLTQRILTTLHTRVSYPEKPAATHTSNVIRLSGAKD